MARERSRQSRAIHNHYGHSPRHLSTMPAGQTNTEDPSGQVCGEGRVYEPGGTEGNQRTSGHRLNFRATIVRRRKSHWGNFALYTQYRILNTSVNPNGYILFFISLCPKRILKL